MDQGGRNNITSIMIIDVVQRVEEGGRGGGRGIDKLSPPRTGFRICNVTMVLTSIDGGMLSTNIVCQRAFKK